MSGPTSAVQVHVDIGGESVAAGTAYVQERRGATSTSFTYDGAFVASAQGYDVTPELELSTRTHHVSGLPGAFHDCSPDRWGRNLIARQLRSQAVRDQVPPRAVGELDYLLGVSDLTRQGALRFRRSPDPDFLHATADVPKLLELPRLLRAADAVVVGDDTLAPVKELLDAGTGSLGGARPKASARDGTRLLIAKFPHRSDTWDVTAWEMTLLDLAERAGIAVPTRRLVSVGTRRALLLDRFDRAGQQRLGYVSAMTLVKGEDVGSYDYLEVAERLTDVGSAVAADLKRLWRRIAISPAVNNTDDHLRNHGFLRAGSGWTLSPMFDVNPDPDPDAHRATSIGYTTTRPEGFDALLNSVADFGLDADEGRQILLEVSAAVSEWRAVANRHGISRSQQNFFTDAFTV